MRLALKLFFFAAVLAAPSFPVMAQSPVFCYPGSGSISQSSPCQSSNPLYVTPATASGGGTSRATTAALAASLVVNAAAGNLYGFEISADSTLSAAAWWIMVFDATSAPSNGAVTPAKCYALPSGTTLSTTANNPLGLSTRCTSSRNSSIESK